MNEHPRVVAVVLDWNGAQRTERCVAALARLGDPALTVVVVDNGSDDPSRVRGLASRPDVRIVRSERNLGFSGGCNLGLRAARGEAADYVWLLNNDAEPQPGSLGSMLAIAGADPGIGAVGCVLHESDRGRPTTVFGGGRVSFWSGLARHHATAVPADRVDYLRGASLLIRSPALDAIGGLDERFFLFWEDTDLCFRMRAAGLRLAVAPDAVVRHEGGASLALVTPAWDFHFTASSVLFFRRHARFPFWPIGVSGGGRLARRLLQGRWSNASAVWRGLRCGLRGAIPPTLDPSIVSR